MIYFGSQINHAASEPWKIAVSFDLRHAKFTHTDADISWQYNFFKSLLKLYYLCLHVPTTHFNIIATTNKKENWMEFLFISFIGHHVYVVRKE